MLSYPCEAPAWVFLINALFDDTPVEDENGVLVAKCHCWQPTETNFSILPGETISGANCVMESGSRGRQMCDRMKAEALASTHRPTGTKLAPLTTAVSEPRTPWAWCFGAPCSKVGDEIICDCPMMITNNALDKSLSLPIDTCQEEFNPCGNIPNSMPAGDGPASYDPGVDACYGYPQ